MCRQCACGGCAFYFRNRGAPTNRALASACSPTPTTQTILNWVHPPKAPLKGGFLALCFLSQFKLSATKFPSKAQLRWIGVGLVLAACAGRSTLSGRAGQVRGQGAGGRDQGRDRGQWGQRGEGAGGRRQGRAAGQGSQPRVPGGFTLRAVGARSEPRAPMQMVSGALGSLGV